MDPTYKQEKREENGIREGDVVKEPEWCGAMSRGMWAASSFLPSVAQYSVWLFVTPWTVAHHGWAPLSMRFPRQEYWSGLPFPPPGDLPDLGIKPTSPASPVLQVDSLPAEPSGKPMWAASRSWKRHGNRFPSELPEGRQSWWYLYFSLVRTIFDYWSSEG